MAQSNLMVRFNKNAMLQKKHMFRFKAERGQFRLADLQRWTLGFRFI